MLTSALTMTKLRLGPVGQLSDVVTALTLTAGYKFGRRVTDPAQCRREPTK